MRRAGHVHQITQDHLIYDDRFHNVFDDDIDGGCDRYDDKGMGGNDDDDEE